MGYITRHTEATVNKAAKMFPAVLITGARQVGKTTLLKYMKSELPYLTLDDPILLQSAIEEAGSFFKMMPPPIIVDEIQYAPNLFSYIKMSADESGRKGQFFLTGSQQFKMMKNVSESLAGRIGIILMKPLYQQMNILKLEKRQSGKLITKKYGKLFIRAQCPPCMRISLIGRCFMLPMPKPILSVT